MTGDEAVRIVALVAWLALMIGAYASFRLEWKDMVRQLLIWAAIFAGVTFIVTLIMGG